MDIYLFLVLIIRQIGFYIKEQIQKIFVVFFIIYVFFVKSGTKPYSIYVFPSYSEISITGPDIFIAELDIKMSRPTLLRDFHLL